MLTFLSPLFLVGAGAAAVPIVLHLLKREPVPRVKFAAVKLLKHAPVEDTEKHRLRELLLLALRVAALVLLALALMTQLVPRTAKLVRRAPVIPSSSARVAVVPVGADPATVALADALRTELSLPGAVRSNREEEGWPTARDSPAVDVGSPPPELLEGLRGRANSTFVILTNATPGDGATQVNLALYRTTDGRSLASTRLSGAPASFPDLAGRTGAWARSALGLPALTTEETRRLRAAHPATIDVAQRLASARTLLRLWRPGEALPLFEDVLKVEAGFAPALADYATALSRLGRNKAAAAARAHAAQAAMALPELLRVAIERDYWQGVGNSEEERRSNERLYQLTPDEASAVLAPRGRTSAQQLADLEALRAAQSPVTLDPRFDTVEARLAINQGNPSEALAAVDRGER